MCGLQAMPLSKIHAMQNLADHVFTSVEKYVFLEREEGMKEYMRRYALHHKLMIESAALNNPYHDYHKVLDLAKYQLDYGLLYLHKYAFEPIVELLASEEQWAKWGNLIREYKIFGSYCQTELGHGSDVQSLMTTATFDSET